MKSLVKKILLGKYDPVKYWNKRPNPNNELGETKERVAFDIDYISRVVGSEASVLELGPGVGRTFGAYNKGSKITALDISTKYADRLKETAQELGLTLEQVFLEDPKAAFPLKDNSFKVGVCSQVLLHIEPAAVTHSLKELVRVCEKVVIITAYKHGIPVNTGLSHVLIMIISA